MTIDSEIVERVEVLLGHYRYGYSKGNGAWASPDGYHCGWSAMDALTHFLNDKAQTGARIADLAASTRPEYDGTDKTAFYYAEKVWVADGMQWAFVAGLGQTDSGAVGDTPDEAIAVLWLRVHRLEDPRKKVVA